MKLKRFVVELVLDYSCFERNKQGRKVFRYLTRSEFVGFQRKDLKNAKARLEKLESKYSGTLIESRLYQEV